MNSKVFGNSQIRALAAAARRLNRGAPVPALWCFTDPARTPDPAAIAAVLPRGSVVVYRHFGAPDRLTIARRLVGLARRRGLKLLIGADPKLAAQVGADGVHLPERMAHLVRPLRSVRPHWLITVAAHGPTALRRSYQADAAILAPVFPSRSASAVRPIGLRRAEAWARTAPLPVIALGGVTAARAKMLRAFAGLAAVDAFSVD